MTVKDTLFYSNSLIVNRKIYKYVVFQEFKVVDESYCDSGCRGFEPRQSPHFYFPIVIPSLSEAFPLALLNKLKRIFATLR